jgi:hypothetical protein
MTHQGYFFLKMPWQKCMIAYSRLMNNFQKAPLHDSQYSKESRINEQDNLYIPLAHHDGHDPAGLHLVRHAQKMLNPNKNPKP